MTVAKPAPINPSKGIKMKFRAMLLKAAVPRLKTTELCWFIEDRKEPDIMFTDLNAIKTANTFNAREDNL